MNKKNDCKNKKVVLLVAMLFFIISANAQHDTLPYYVGVPQFYMEHSIYDETYDVFSNYNWGFGDLSNIWLCSGNILRPCGYTAGYRETALRFVTDTTLHVIGIATPIPSYFTETVTTPDHFDIGEHLSNLYRILNECDSLWFNIYQPLDSHMTLIKSVMVDTTFDTANAQLYLPTYGTPLSGPPSQDNFSSLGGRGFMWWQPQLMLEVFFDNELDLSDSFYISYRYFGGDWMGESMIQGMVGQNSVVGYFDSLPFTGLRQKRIGATDDDPWYYDEVRCYPLLFPIIRRDCDSCPQVRELQHFKASANKAFFRWQRGTNHHDWQLSYGPVGTAPEDGTIVDYIIPQSGLITLDPDSHYVVYVRARCKFARYEYGPWSAPYTFSINGGNGIEEVSPNEVTLTPNPAADRVTVAAEGMERVELIGVDGTVLLRKDCHGECQIDLTGLAAGLYLVRATTPRGTATRRLVVQ